MTENCVKDDKALMTSATDLWKRHVEQVEATLKSFRDDGPTAARRTHRHHQKHILHTISNRYLLRYFWFPFYRPTFPKLIHVRPAPKRRISGTWRHVLIGEIALPKNSTSIVPTTSQQLLLVQNCETHVFWNLLFQICIFFVFHAGSNFQWAQKLLRWATVWRSATIDMGRKVGAAVPFSVGEGGSPSNTLSPGTKSTSVPSILINPTVWPQYTNVTNRQTGQTTSHSIYRVGRPLLVTVGQKAFFLYFLQIFIQAMN